MENLRKNKYTASFFSGFKPIGASQLMTWNRKEAWKAAGFDKLAKEMSKVKKTPNKARKKRTMADIQNAMKRKKRRET
jgi:phosphoglycerol transferase MdoB-like AlkP superfamily enzyme